MEKLSHAGLEPHRRESTGRWTGTGTGRYFGSGSNTEHSLAMYIEARAHRITTLLMTSVATFPNHHHLCPERKRARADDHAQSYSTAATQSERDIATWGDWRLSHSVEWIRKLKFIESTFLCIKKKTGIKRSCNSFFFWRLTFTLMLAKPYSARPIKLIPVN